MNVDFALSRVIHKWRNQFFAIGDALRRQAIVEPLNVRFASRNHVRRGSKYSGLGRYLDLVCTTP